MASGVWWKVRLSCTMRAGCVVLSNAELPQKGDGVLMMDATQLLAVLSTLVFSSSPPTHNRAPTQSS